MTLRRLLVNGADPRLCAHVAAHAHVAKQLEFRQTLGGPVFRSTANGAHAHCSSAGTCDASGGAATLDPPCDCAPAYEGTDCSVPRCPRLLGFPERC